MLATRPTTIAARIPASHLATAKAFLQDLPAMVGPGMAVPPVVDALAGVRDALAGARPFVMKAGASDWMLGEVDRVRGAASTLGDSLSTLLSSDGMKTFDAAFAADAPAWKAWFAEAADVVGRAEQVVASSQVTT